MDDSIELPALAMSIDDQVKAEAVDQTMVSVEKKNAFAAPLKQQAADCCLVTCLPMILKIIR